MSERKNVASDSEPINYRAQLLTKIEAHGIANNHKYHLREQEQERSVRYSNQPVSREENYRYKEELSNIFNSANPRHNKQEEKVNVSFEKPSGNQHMHSFTSDLNSSLQMNSSLREKLQNSILRSLKEEQLTKMRLNESHLNDTFITLKKRYKKKSNDILNKSIVEESVYRGNFGIVKDITSGYFENLSLSVRRVLLSLGESIDDQRKLIKLSEAAGSDDDLNLKDIQSQVRWNDLGNLFFVLFLVIVGYLIVKYCY